MLFEESTIYLELTAVSFFRAYGGAWVEPGLEITMKMSDVNSGLASSKSVPESNNEYPNPQLLGLETRLGESHLDRDGAEPQRYGEGITPETVANQSDATPSQGEPVQDDTGEHGYLEQQQNTATYDQGYGNSPIHAEAQLIYRQH